MEYIKYKFIYSVIEKKTTELLDLATGTTFQIVAIKPVQSPARTKRSKNSWNDDAKKNRKHQSKEGKLINKMIL